LNFYRLGIQLFLVGLFDNAKLLADAAYETNYASSRKESKNLFI